MRRIVSGGPQWIEDVVSIVKFHDDLLTKTISPVSICSGTSSAHQQAFRWRANDGSRLNAGCVASISRQYYFH